MAKPTIDARAVQVLFVDDAQFKDLNKNMKLGVYED